MHRMSEDEIHAFLGDEPARPAVLATSRPDGKPHAVPVWYSLDGSTIVLTTGAKSVKGRNLLRDPQCALTVQDDRLPYSFALVEGEAAITRDPDELHKWAVAIAGRYLGPEQGAKVGERNAGTDELVVRIIPRRVTGVRNLAE
jgi:PPOX class probable F420-dependent enzyme